MLQKCNNPIARKIKKIKIKKNKKKLRNWKKKLIKNFAHVNITVFIYFQKNSLTKDEKKRPKYKVLLQHPLIEIHTKSNVNVSEYVEPYIIEMEQQNKI